MYRYAIKELLSHKSRIAATIAGYAIAVAFMAIAVSLVAYSEEKTTALLSLPGTKFVVFVPVPAGGASGAGGPYAEGVSTTMLKPEVLATMKKTPGVTSAVPYLLFRGPQGAGHGFLTIAGLDLTHLGTWESFCAPTDLIQGRFITPSDERAVILEQSYALAARRGVNDLLPAFGRVFRVVGIVNTNVRPVKPDMYAPLPVVREIARGDMNIVLVTVAEPRVQDEAMRAARAVVPGSVLLTYNCYKPARTAIILGSGLAWTISLLLALFAILFAGKAQVAFVVARTRDIAVLKTIGWSGSAVVRQVLLESILQSLTGLTAGTVAALLALVTLRISTPFWAGLGPRPETLVIGWTLILLGGVAAGAASAGRAYRLTPAEALRRR
jgi:hypothetical protein